MSKKLVKSTALVASMTLISRLFGFMRDLAWAQVFGSVAGFDAFIIAFKIPNFMRNLFAEGAFSQAFVPILSEYCETQDKQAVRQFVSYMAGDLALILSLVVALGVMLAPLLVMIFAPGFLHDPSRFELTQYMLRITFPYLLLISLTAFSGSILNSHGNFGIPAFTPVLLNVTLIIATLWIAPRLQQPLLVLPWAICVAGAAQLLLQVPFLKKAGMLTRWRLSFQEPGIRRVFKLMLGALFGVSVAQISLFIDTLFASFLPAGSISWIYYSERLMGFPLGIIGVAIATVTMPQLARKYAAKSRDEFAQTLAWALRSVLLIGVPSAVGLFLLAEPMLATLFKYGKFTVVDVKMTARSLKAFAIGVPAFMLVKVLTTGFYARQNVRTPVKIAAIALAINIILNALLIVPLAHAGLALSTSLAAWGNVMLLIFYLKQEGEQLTAVWWKFALKLGVSAVAMMSWLLLATPGVQQWFVWGMRKRALYIAGLILVAQFIYFIALRLLGIRIKDFLKTTA